jgi:hypothetical protein
MRAVVTSHCHGWVGEIEATTLSMSMNYWVTNALDHRGTHAGPIKEPRIVLARRVAVIDASHPVRDGIDSRGGWRAVMGFMTPPIPCLF